MLRHFHLCLSWIKIPHRGLKVIIMSHFTFIDAYFVSCCRKGNDKYIKCALNVGFLGGFFFLAYRVVLHTTCATFNCIMAQSASFKLKTFLSTKKHLSFSKWILKRCNICVPAREQQWVRVILPRSEVFSFQLLIHFQVCLSQQWSSILVNPQIHFLAKC